MVVFFTARRLKPGAWDQFRRAWDPGDEKPPGFQRAYHARNIRDEDEVISFGLFDMTLDDYHAWRGRGRRRGEPAGRQALGVRGERARLGRLRGHRRGRIASAGAPRPAHRRRRRARPPGRGPRPAGGDHAAPVRSRRQPAAGGQPVARRDEGHRLVGDLPAGRGRLRPGGIRAAPRARPAAGRHRLRGVRRLPGQHHDRPQRGVGRPRRRDRPPEAGRPRGRGPARAGPQGELDRRVGRRERPAGRPGLPHQDGAALRDPRAARDPPALPRLVRVRGRPAPAGAAGVRDGSAGAAPGADRGVSAPRRIRRGV